MSETKKNFEKRVFEATGVELSQIPVGEPNDALLHIMCKRGNVYIVAYGYPDYQDDNGNDVWESRPENFRVVTLS